MVSIRRKIQQMFYKIKCLKDRGFDNLDAIFLLPTNNKVNKFNVERIEKLGIPIALMKSKNAGKGSKCSAIKSKVSSIVCIEHLILK